MSRAGRLRAVLPKHPLARDGLLAAVVFVACAALRPGDGPRWSLLDPVNTAVLVVACAALTARRRWPLQVWAVTTVAGLVGLVHGGGSPSTVAIPALVAVYTVASHRDPSWAVTAGAVTALSFFAALTDRVDHGVPSQATFALLGWSGTAAALGYAVRSQRAVISAARERAVRAEESREAEAQRRVAEERVRIARDLHDVVAHHIAVINVQAGVAGHLIDTQPGQARQALAHVRQSSQLVLAEMATILGLLRTDDAAPQRYPTPTLRRVDDLVDDMRRAGMTVTSRISGEPVELPPITDLAAHRLVQEALTNARKHGLGHADLTIRYGAHVVEIQVVNPVPPGAVDRRADSATGHGLTGMAERVAAAGGRLTVGPAQDGRFRVHAELPVARLPQADQADQADQAGTS